MTEQLWVEKYRPETLDDVVGHDACVARMQDYVDRSDMPNLMFAGRQGIGKTAIAQAFAKERYGDQWRKYFLDMNASDDRGIGIVRNQIKEFARAGAGEYDWKIIFLDESDQLTNEAQSALRRVMEDYSDVTRFILSCNYPNQIIDPIQSRMAPFRLTPLSDEEVRKLAEKVLDEEGVEADDAAIDAVVKESRGDARQVIHTLQMLSLNGELNSGATDEILGKVDEEVVEEVVGLAINGDLDEACSRLDASILKSGASIDSVMESFLWVLKRSNEFNEEGRGRALDALGRVDKNMREGSNEHVQMHSLLANLLVARHCGSGGYES